jgi:probable rRNA maturation factor
MMEPGSPDPASAGIRKSARLQPRRGAAPPTVVVLDRKWRSLVPHAEILASRAAAAAGGAGTVVLSSDRAVKALNGLHRNRNKPTNVLTFEFCDRSATPTQGYLRGDIVLALGTVCREAQAAGRPVSHHMAHLVVHGALHLRGHDHDHVGDARRMELAEARILGGLGVPNPWKRR